MHDGDGGAERNTSEEEGGEGSYDVSCGGGPTVCVGSPIVALAFSHSQAALEINLGSNCHSHHRMELSAYNPLLRSHAVAGHGRGVPFEDLKMLVMTRASSNL